MTTDVSEMKVESESADKLREPTHKKFAYPGSMTYADVRSNFPGCAVKMFTVRDEMSDSDLTVDTVINDFFKENRGLLVVNMQPINADTVLVTYTRTISPEEMAEYEEVGELVQAEMQKRREARAKDEAKVESAKAAKEEEVKRLVLKGMKCEKEHGDVGKKEKGRSK